MAEDFSEKVSKKSNEQLFEIIIKRKSYFPGLVSASLAEIKKRGLTKDEITLLQTIEGHVEDENNPRLFEEEKPEKFTSFRRSNKTITLIILICTVLYIGSFFFTQMGWYIPASAVMLAILSIIIYLRFYLKVPFALIYAVTLINIALLFVPKSEARVSVDEGKKAMEMYNPIAVMIYVPLLLIGSGFVLWYFMNPYIKISPSKIIIDGGLFGNKNEIFARSITKAGIIPGTDIVEIHYAASNHEYIRLKFFSPADREKLLGSLKSMTANFE